MKAQEKKRNKPTAYQRRKQRQNKRERQQFNATI